MIGRLFNHRIRGFRTVNLVLAALLAVLAVGVNFAKTFAGRERNEIGEVVREIGREKSRIRVLEAEVAHLEQPERLERLSRRYLAMAPVTARQETAPDGLAGLAARTPRPQPASTSSLAVR
ncbi:MAG: cell division protein FtsL [Pseudomonadota bacterium]